MPRTDRSAAFLTGMIMAALYVILLVGFSRESYMRRDAGERSTVGQSATDGLSKSACCSEIACAPPP
jgi:hypothetical protein